MEFCINCHLCIWICSKLWMKGWDERLGWKSFWFIWFYVQKVVAISMGTELGLLSYYHFLKKMCKICWYCSLSNLKTVTSGMQNLFIEDSNYILPNKNIRFSSLTLFKGETENILKENNVSSFLQIIRMTFS